MWRLCRRPPSPSAPGGVFRNESVNANPQRTVQAYAWGLLDHGGRIRQHTRVTDINVVNDKVVSVETSAGTVGADYVVCAGGPQTGVLAEKAGVFENADGRLQAFEQAERGLVVLVERDAEGQGEVVHGSRFPVGEVLFQAAVVAAFAAR